MACVYTVRYYSGTSIQTPVVDEFIVYESNTSDRAPNNARVTIQSPYRLGGQYSDTGNTVPVQYFPIRSTGERTLGVEWWKDEKIFDEYQPYWRHSEITVGTHYLNNISAWGILRESDVTHYLLELVKVHKQKVVKLTCPASKVYSGVYGSAAVRYLTINYGYKEPTKINLSSQCNYTVNMLNWIVESGSTVTPGSIKYMPYNNESSFVIDGVYASIINHQKRSDAKTYKQLLQSVDTTRPAETVNYKVNLVSDNRAFHDSETINASKSVYYVLNGWKTNADPLTAANQLNQNLIPYNENVTIYADWKVSDVQPHNVFPTWSTEERLPYGSEPVRYVNLECRSKYNGKVYFSTRFGEYASKQAKHTGWTNNSQVWSIGDSVPVDENTTYYAQWAPDESKESVLSIVDNLVKLPPPPARSGFTHIGFSQENTTTPEYKPDSEIRVTADLVLFAIWKADGAVEIYKDETTCKRHQVWIFDGDQWKLYIPKVFNGTEWKIVI